jgi:phosphoribosyl-dephospho-CoA transferase
MLALHRHQLAWLTESGWDNLRGRAWDDEARPCIEHWASHRLPLVVTRQPADIASHAKAAELIAVAISAPVRWNRRRLALRIARSEIAYLDEFPVAQAATMLVPMPARPAWSALCAGLATAGVTARLYGSYGWQLLTGLDHVRAGSDIDVWLAVSSAQQADAAGACLQKFSSDALNADGEFMFDGGAAVAWREWLAWRQGKVRGLLVKTLVASSLVHPVVRDSHFLRAEVSS